MSTPLCHLFYWVTCCVRINERLLLFICFMFVTTLHAVHLLSDHSWLLPLSGYFVLQHELLLRSTDFTTPAAESAEKNIMQIFHDLIYCLEDLGVWLTLKVLALLLKWIYNSNVCSWLHHWHQLFFFFVIGCRVLIFQWHWVSFMWKLCK